MTERPDIYFLHLPKTAGSSLASIIRSAYPQSQAVPAYEWQQLVLLDRAQINSYVCFSGHFGTGLYSLLDREVPTVTMLRDPFERAISHLLYAQRLDPARYGALGLLITGTRWLWEQSKNKQFRAWLEKGTTNVLLRDLQTRMLGVDVDLNPFLGKRSYLDYSHLLMQHEKNVDMDEVLERAKRRLDACVVVGLVEDMDTSLSSICTFLKIDQPAQAPMINANKAGKTAAAENFSYRNSGLISEDLTELIDRITHLDRQLYIHAQALIKSSHAQAHYQTDR